MKQLFIQSMTWRPVLDKDDPSKLAQHVEKLCESLKLSGRDPLTEISKCATLIRNRMEMLCKKHHPNSKIITNDDPKQLGSLAWYKYLQDRVNEIIGVLLNRKLDTEAE